jgi:hypothetical protein
MFWLLFVVTIGILTMLISVMLESTSSLIKKVLSRGSYSYVRLEWRANHPLHLQRLAHEALGSGEWKCGLWDIPVTSSSSTLSAFNNSYSTTLPRLEGLKTGHPTAETTIEASPMETKSPKPSIEINGPTTDSLVVDCPVAKAPGDGNRPEHTSCEQ